MVNREIFWRKLSALETHLKRVRIKRDVSLEELKGDIDRQESIFFNLQTWTSKNSRLFWPKGSAEQVRSDPK